jgi:hypothetical protein
MKSILTFTFLFFLILTSKAQLVTTPLYSLKVTQVASVAPDFAVVAVKFRKSNAELASLGLVQIFKDLEIDINLFGVEDELVTKSVTQKDSLGYFKDVFIRVNKLDKLDMLLIQLEKRGVNVSAVQIGYSNMEDLKLQAYNKAIKQAQNQKTNLNQTLGGKIGKLFLVKELNSFVENLDNSGNRSSITVNTLPGLVNVIVELEVSFELAQ